MAAASVTGAFHAAANEANQDRHRLLTTPAGMLVAVVSDGAGSAPFGAEGAAAICDCIVGRLGSLFDGDPVCSRFALGSGVRAVRDAVRDARSQVARLAAARGCEISAFHATMVGAAMLPGGGGILFQIGDGAALAIASEDRWLLSAPANGEYAGTTFFYTEPDWRCRLRFQLVDPGFETVFLMSDGVTDLGLVRRGEASEAFMPFFAPIARFLSSADRERGEAALHATLDAAPARARSDDDKTLIWANWSAE